MKLNELSEKIFIDRYAKKHTDTKQVKIGDTVVAIVNDDPNSRQIKVGQVIYKYTDTIQVKLRDDSIIEIPFDKFQIALETEPNQMWDRVAKEIAKSETIEKQSEWEEKFRYALDDWKLVPGGRIVAGAGNDNLTMFNCYVIPSPRDSREGIMESVSSMVEIMSRGGGVGVNLSSLRPNRSRVIGVSGTSSGSVSWGGLYSYATGLVEQGGSRRGALLLMLNDWHPDLLEFITAKKDMNKITNANLSVGISDAFMNAVKNDLDWDLIFPDTTDSKYNEIWDGDINTWRSQGGKIITYKTMRAREIWDTLIEAAWRSAEPGLVFMERYNNISNTWYFNPIICTNPCAR